MAKNSLGPVHDSVGKLMEASDSLSSAIEGIAQEPDDPDVNARNAEIVYEITREVKIVTHRIYNELQG